MNLAPLRKLLLGLGLRLRKEQVPGIALLPRLSGPQGGMPYHGSIFQAFACKPSVRQSKSQLHSQSSDAGEHSQSLMEELQSHMPKSVDRVWVKNVARKSVEHSTDDIAFFPELFVFYFHSH